MSDPAKPIRNVYYAIDLLMKGHRFDSFRDRIEVRHDAVCFWTYAIGGASVVLRNRGVSVDVKKEFAKLSNYVEMLP